MIVVKVTTNGITVDGHAGYAEPGKDIVCSAVTALTFNLIDSLEALTKDSIEYEADNPGHIDIHFENLSEQGCLLVDSFFIGISNISNAYGEEYVKITVPNGH